MRVGCRSGCKGSNIVYTSSSSALVCLSQGSDVLASHRGRSERRSVELGEVGVGDCKWSRVRARAKASSSDVSLLPVCTRIRRGASSSK